MINAVPVPNEDPPVEAAYQFNIPALAVACKVIVPLPQIESEVVEATEGIVFTLASTAVLEAVVQPLDVAST